MKKLRHILAIYDDGIGGDDVLVQAVRVARGNGANLTIAKPLGNYPGSPATVSEAERRLSRLIPWINQEGVDNVSTGVILGTPHVEIAREVLLKKYDLVIAGEQAGGGLKDIIRGSVAHNLVRKCPAPVWIVRRRRGSVQGVLAAVEAPLDDPSNPLDVSVVEKAAEIAASINSRLHVLHSWQIEGGDAEMLSSEIRDTTRRSILDSHASRRSRAVKTLLDNCRLHGVTVHTHLPRGDHLQNIIMLAGQLGPELTVMGTAGRDGLQRLLSGNAVETVMAGTRCGVLAVKPDDYRTPIAMTPYMADFHAAGADGR
ncbi:MAG: universal stress protein [Hyphomicrobiales bacterium]